MAVLLLALALFALAGAAYWCVVVLHVVRAWVRHPTARAGLGLGAVIDRVCVVVPAHNEAAQVGDLVRSLKAQTHERLTVVLALDRCTDGTGEAARAAIDGDARFEIVEITECPEGWAGKVHAVHRGMECSASAREADVVVFADADTVFDPECVRACAALRRDRGAALLSLISTMTFDRWFERVAQPACGIELLRQYPPERASRAERRRAFANGQFMMFDAAAYRAIGGHREVREALLEDIELARRVRDAGLGALVVLADGLVTCRMYASWAEFRRGWKRIYTEAATRRDDRLARSGWMVRLTGLGFALGGLGATLTGAAAWSDAPVLGPVAAWSGVACLLAMTLGVGLAYGRGRVPLWLVPTYPIGAWLAGSILREASGDLRANRPTEWAGRTYARERRG